MFLKQQLHFIHLFLHFYSFYYLHFNIPGVDLVDSFRHNLFPANLLTSNDETKQKQGTQNTQPKKNRQKPKPKFENSSHLCISLQTSVVHNTAQNSSDDNLQS